MLRKLFLGSAAALALAIPAVSTSQAQAGGVSFDISFGRPYGYGYVSYFRPYHVHHHQHFRVLYRTCCDQPWCSYGCYDCEGDAYRVCERLRCRGWEARLVLD